MAASKDNDGARRLCSSCKGKGTAADGQASTTSAAGGGSVARGLSMADQREAGEPAERSSTGAREPTRAASLSPLALRLSPGVVVPLPSSPRSPLAPRQGYPESLPAALRLPSTAAASIIRPSLALYKSDPGQPALPRLGQKKGSLKPPSSPRAGVGSTSRLSPSLVTGWTPPLQHGILAGDSVDALISPGRNVRDKRSTPSLPDDALAVDLPPPTTTAPTVESAPSTPAVNPPPATYFLPALHRRMSDADLAALTERTKLSSPHSPSHIKGRLDLSSLRQRGGIGETPRVVRAAPPPAVERTVAQSLLARSDSIGSSGSSAGQSVRSVALREKRKARVRARTVGAYDINEEQLLCEVVGAPPRPLPSPPSSRNARLARPETQLYLLPSSATPSSSTTSAPASRPVTPNTAWRQSLFTEAVGQSLRSGSSSARSSSSHFPSPPTPPELPPTPNKSPRFTTRRLPRQSRRLTDADRAGLASTPDLFGALPTVRRQASGPLLSDTLRDSIVSSLFSDDDLVAQSSTVRLHWAGIAAGGDFDPDEFERAELYTSVGSSNSDEVPPSSSTLSSSSSGRTVDDMALPTMTTAEDATGGVSVYGDEVDGDELSERGTLGERRGKGGPTLVIQVIPPPADVALEDSIPTPRLRDSSAPRSPLATRFRRSVSSLPSATEPSTVVADVAWASRASSPAATKTGSFYGIASLTSSTPNLPSQDTMPVVVDVPPVPSSAVEYQPATPLLQDLDPRLPITNTVPRLPPSTSAVIKGIFTRRRRSKYRPSSGVSSADPEPSLGTVLERARLASVPLSAFSSSSNERVAPPTPPPTPKTPAATDSSEDRTVATWAATTAARDPAISRLEGLLHQHQELERERLRLIIDGPARPARSTRRVVV